MTTQHHFLQDFKQRAEQSQQDDIRSERRLFVWQILTTCLLGALIWAREVYRYEIISFIQNLFS